MPGRAGEAMSGSSDAMPWSSDGTAKRRLAIQSSAIEIIIDADLNAIDLPTCRRPFLLT